MKDEEFERLYTEEAQGLFAFLAYRTGDRSLAEDLLADAFERALRGKFNPRKGSAKTWLYTIALRNAAYASSRVSAPCVTNVTFLPPPVRARPAPAVLNSIPVTSIARMARRDFMDWLLREGSAARRRTRCLIASSSRSVTWGGLLRGAE